MLNVRFGILSLLKVYNKTNSRFIPTHSWNLLVDEDFSFELKALEFG